MKIVGGILMLCLFSSMGMYASGQLDRRIRQLKSLEKAILSMKRELDYRASPLAETFLYTACRTEYPWNLFFEEAGKGLMERNDHFGGPDEVFSREAAKVRPFHPWDRDLEVLTGLGKHLGDMDKKMQLMHLSIAEEEICGLLQEAKEEKRIKGKLYQTLGICMGILSVIMVM